MEQIEIIGRNIQMYCKSMGLSQDVFANYLGISREEVSYFETGSRSASTDIISKASKLFGIAEYDLYQEELSISELNIAFRMDEITQEDLQSIAAFKKIALNYLKMKYA